MSETFPDWKKKNKAHEILSTMNPLEYKSIDKITNHILSTRNTTFDIKVPMG